MEIFTVPEYSVAVFLPLTIEPALCDWCIRYWLWHW